jgi:enterochelin esterase-like enzyme
MIKRLLFIIFLASLIAPGSVLCQSFSTFIQQLASADESLRRSMALQYLQQQEAIPIIEADTIAHFLYWGNANMVALAGDATGWLPSMKMDHTAGTPLWYATAHYPPDTRVEYKIVVDGKNWLLDSLNKQVIEGGMGKNSVLTMPAYERPRLIYERNVAPWGTYSDTVIKSKYLKEARQVRIYLPPGYAKSTSRYPVIIFHDGFEFFDRMAARNIIDNMIFEKKMQPVIAIFVQPVHRDPEYSGKLQAKYTRFVSEELVSFLDAGYRTLPGAGNRAQAGISNGGNISLWICISHPELFGKAAAFSSNVEDNVFDASETAQSLALQVYLLLGKYDLLVLIPWVQRLKSILENKNYKLLYREYPEGHNWAFWQKYMPEALEYLFPLK